jgi:ATP-dependent helicase/nuclease subunit B
VGVFEEVESGAAVLTATKRLARALTGEYTKYQREQGRAAWRSPAILTWSGFVQRCRREWLADGAAGSFDPIPVPLSAAQERVVWERAILDSPAGDTLLQVEQTAQRAMDAWALARAYRVPLRAGTFQAGDDCAAFLGWARKFERRCGENAWMEGARLPDFIADLIRERRIAAPERVYLAGFDELTPQQRDFVEALGGAETFSIDDVEGRASTSACSDSAEEIRRAAHWSRAVLERNPEAKIGVVVPNLERLRAPIERAFRDALRDERAFHVSLGPALAEYPLVSAAFLILEAAMGAIPASRAGMLLRSPFVGGASEERSQRALLDLRLRRDGRWRWTLDGMLKRAENCPLLQKHLRALQSEKAPSLAKPSAWSAAFTRMLKAAAWPGERTLSSVEYQIREAWQELLSTFATLDAMLEPMACDAALERLRALADETPFQTENEGAPVQVMGMLEAAGLRFDALWVMGLHDEAWPAPAHANPFLPLALQRERNAPHSSAERELEYARKLMRRLMASASEIVLSYPRMEGEEERRPSPLIVGPPMEMRETAPDWSEATWEWIAEDRAPALEQMEQRGGTRLLQDMAACPFRAYARHRLGAREMDESSAGLSARDKGKAVHRALELIWGELKTQRALRALTEDEVTDVVRRAVDTALVGEGVGRKLEALRLRGLLTRWLEIEKHRPEFQVEEFERERQVMVGGLLLGTRADRVDRLADGRRMVLDYKTGDLKPGGWEGERLDEPQVPLYCVSSEREVAAAAFVQIRVNELGFRGLADEGAAPAGMKLMRGTGGSSMKEQIADWKRALEALASRFREGAAEVDPKHGACDFCALTALCRVLDHD